MNSRRNDASTDLEKLIHDCEFENQQYVKLIEHEDTLLSNIEKEIEWKRGDIKRIESETPQADAEIKQLHRQFVQNRDNLESQKKTTQILTDQIAATTKKFEVLNMQRELERKEHQSILEHYQDIATKYKDKYESLPLAMEWKKAKEREEELKQQVQEKKNNINRLNHKMQLLLCRRDGKTMTEEDQGFIVKLAEARVANLKLFHEVDMKKKQLNAMKNQISERQNQAEFTAERIVNEECSESRPEPIRQTSDMDSAMISLYSSRDESGETMQVDQDPAVAAPPSTEITENNRDPPQSWLSSFQKVQPRDPVPQGVEYVQSAPPPIQSPANVPAQSQAKSPVPPYVSYRRSGDSEDTVQVHLQRPSRPVQMSQQVQRTQDQIQQRPAPPSKRTLPIQLSPRIPVLRNAVPTNTTHSTSELINQRLKVPKLELSTQVSRSLSQPLINQQSHQQNPQIRRENIPRQAFPLVQMQRKPLSSQFSKEPVQPTVQQMPQTGVHQYSQQNKQIPLPIMNISSPQLGTQPVAVSQQPQVRTQISTPEIRQMPQNQALRPEHPPISQHSVQQNFENNTQRVIQPLVLKKFQHVDSNQQRQAPTSTSQPQLSMQQFQHQQMQKSQTTKVSPLKYTPNIQPKPIQNERQNQEHQNEQEQNVDCPRPMQNHQSLHQIEQNQTITRDQQYPNSYLSPPQAQCSPYKQQEQDMLFKIPMYPAPAKHRSPVPGCQRSTQQNNSVQEATVDSPTSPNVSVTSPPSAPLSYLSPRPNQEGTDQDVTDSDPTKQQDGDEESRQQDLIEQEIRIKMLGPKEPYYMKLKSCPEDEEPGETNSGQDTTGRSADFGSLGESQSSTVSPCMSTGDAFYTNEEMSDQNSLESSMERLDFVQQPGNTISDAEMPNGNYSPFNMEKHKEKLAELKKSPGAPTFTAGRRMFPSQANGAKNSSIHTEEKVRASGDNIKSSAALESETAFSFSTAFGGSTSSPATSKSSTMFNFGGGDSTESSDGAFSLFGPSAGDSSPATGFNIMGQNSASPQQSGRFGIFGVGATPSKEQDNSDYLSSLFGPAGDEDQEQSSGFSFSFGPSSVASPQQKKFSLF